MEVVVSLQCFMNGLQRVTTSSSLLVNEISRRLFIYIITVTYPSDEHVRHRTILRKKE